MEQTNPVIELVSLINYKICHIHSSGEKEIHKEILIPGYETDILARGKAGYSIRLNTPDFMADFIERYLEVKEQRRIKNQNWNNFSCPYTINNKIIKDFLECAELRNIAFNTSIINYFVALKSFLRKKLLDSDNNKTFIMFLEETLGCQAEWYKKYKPSDLDDKVDEKKFKKEFFKEICEFLQYASWESEFDINAKSKDFLRYAPAALRDYLEQFLSDMLVCIAIGMERQYYNPNIINKNAEREIGKLMRYAIRLIENKFNNFTMFYKIRHYIHSEELLRIHKRKIENYLGEEKIKKIKK